MRNKYIPILICLAALLCSSPALAKISATIDRDQIALDETLTLTITKDGRSSISSGDLKPLENDFKIMGKNQSSNTQFINGSVSSSFTLDLVLAPKRAGKLEIPPLFIDNEKTDKLYIKVVTQVQPKVKADSAPLFIETDVSAQTIFVQSQLILTLRIYWAVEASISEPTDPQIKNALMERLDDTTYNKVIENQSYKVFERKYAIFPQKSGRLEIPQIIVQATVPDRQQRRRDFYGFFGSRGREIKLRSESTIITVEEKVEAYPAGAEWLPTNKLSIAEEWSLKPEELQVGESVTITIAMAAQGLLGGQLPPISLPEAEGVKLYQGKAEVQNLTNVDGITGIRKESIALIPVRAGKVELPEIKIPWWNKTLQKIEYAVIPARQLVIKSTNNKTTITSELPPSLENAKAPATAVTKVLPVKDTRQNKLLLGLCTFLGFAWLITIYLLIKTRLQLTNLLSGDQLKTNVTTDINEKTAFREFEGFCRNNDPSRARKAVIDWARTLRPEENFQTADDLINIYPDSNLATIFEEIDNILYNQGGDAADWCGKNLLKTVEDIRKNKRISTKKESTLQQLYK